MIQKGIHSEGVYPSEKDPEHELPPEFTLLQELADTDHESISSNSADSCLQVYVEAELEGHRIASEGAAMAPLGSDSGSEASDYDDGGEDLLGATFAKSFGAINLDAVAGDMEASLCGLATWGGPQFMRLSMRYQTRIHDKFRELCGDGLIHFEVFLLFAQQMGLVDYVSQFELEGVFTDLKDEDDDTLPLEMLSSCVVQCLSQGTNQAWDEIEGALDAMF